MNDDDLFRPEEDAPKKKQDGSGCVVKFVLVLIAAVGGATLLCCCGIGFFAYSLAPTIEEDPAVAQQNLDELIEIELPEGYQPELAISMDLFDFAQIKGSIVQSGDNGGVLVVAGLQGQLSENEQFIDGFKNQLRQQSGDENMQVLEKEVREFEISGQTIEFVFVHGSVKDQQTGEEQEIRQVTAILPGRKAGKTFFLLYVPEESWDEAEAVQMIESIKLQKAGPGAEPPVEEQAVEEPEAEVQAGDEQEADAKPEGTNEGPEEATDSESEPASEDSAETEATTP